MHQGDLVLALAADSGLEQLVPGRIAVTVVIQPLSLSTADIARGGTASGVRILVVRDECAPIVITGSLDGGPDVFSGQWHDGLRTALAELDSKIAQTNSVNMYLI
jgi:hypothetical protein